MKTKILTLLLALTLYASPLTGRGMSLILPWWFNMRDVWQEIKILKQRLAELKARIARQAALIQAVPILRAGDIQESTNKAGTRVYRVKERAATSDTSNEYTDLRTYDTDPGPAFGPVAFSTDEDGEKNILPNASRIVSIQDTDGAGGGKHVEIDTNENISTPAGSETLDIVIAEPVAQFHDSTYPLLTGRIYAGQKMQNVDASVRKYLALLQGFGGASKIFNPVFGTGNFTLNLDAAGKVIDFAGESTAQARYICVTNTDFHYWNGSSWIRTFSSFTRGNLVMCSQFVFARDWSTTGNKYSTDGITWLNVTTAPAWITASSANVIWVITAWNGTLKRYGLVGGILAETATATLPNDLVLAGGLTFVAGDAEVLVFPRNITPYIQNNGYPTQIIFSDFYRYFRWTVGGGWQTINVPVPGFVQNGVQRVGGGVANYSSTLYQIWSDSDITSPSSYYYFINGAFLAFGGYESPFPSPYYKIEKSYNRNSIWGITVEAPANTNQYSVWEWGGTRFNMASSHNMYFDIHYGCGSPATSSDAYLGYNTSPMANAFYSVTAGGRQSILSTVGLTGTLIRDFGEILVP